MNERKVQCKLGVKGCPHERNLAFSDWMRENLPKSDTGLNIFDIDFIVYNTKSKKLIIIEKKCFKEKEYHGSEVNFSQRFLLKMVYKLFKQLPDQFKDWEFVDMNLIQFDGYDFNTGKCYLDYNEISEQELKKYLSI